jgi:hypothetical protein
VDPGLVQTVRDSESGFATILLIPSGSGAEKF